MRTTAVLTILLLTGCAMLGAPPPTDDVVAAAEAFRRALAAGDEAAVRVLLAPDALIYEAGGQERSRDEYMSHHMKGDMAFLAKAQMQVVERKHDAGGELAWVATRARITGTHRDRTVDVFSTESLVLRRGAGGWQIVHVHWSSRPAKPAEQ